MQLTFRRQATAGFALVGAAAAAVAIMAAAFAPTARADDFSDIVTDVNAVLGAGSTDLSAAATDFSALVERLIAAEFDRRRRSRGSG